MPRKRTVPLTEEEDQYRKDRMSYRASSHRHVLVMELDVTKKDRNDLIIYSHWLCRLSNRLTWKMQNNCIQMWRLKKYRGARHEYGEVAKALKKDPKNKELTARKKEISDELREFQEKTGVTMLECGRLAERFRRDLHVDSVTALAVAEDVWSGVEKLLYKGGKRLHFHRRDDLLPIRARQINKEIIMKYPEGAADTEPIFCFQKMKLSIRRHDTFIDDELRAVAEYMRHPEETDRWAVERKKAGELVDTFRPVCASIVLKEIRGKIRVYLHLVIEGNPLPKKDKNGNPRHKLGKGRVGCDIGTQSIAWTSDTEVGLDNLAERGRPIDNEERKLAELSKKMDRSRRATNPDHYNEDGTVKKKGHWKKSGNYLRMEKQYREICRKSAASRRCANLQYAHHLRSLGDEFITEPKNAAKLAKRAKETTVNEKTGRINSKKRFGRSVRKRCPGGFQAAVKRIFLQTGGSYHEVENGFKASQYDHTADTCTKKKLSQRMFVLADGSLVQRDCYSSFLLYNADEEYAFPSREKCLGSFDTFSGREQALINRIRSSDRRIMNSGIRPWRHRAS